MTEKIEFDLYVNGADEQTPQEVDQQEGQPSTTNPATPTSAAGTTRTAIAANLAINAAKSTANYVTSNIGTWTGNQYAQKKADQTMKIIGMAAMVAANPALGIANIALQGTFDIIDTVIQRRWERKDYERQMARYGLGSFRNQ